MCGGSDAPPVPQEQKDLLKAEADIAKKEWSYKEPALNMMQSWSTGGEIPSYLMPDFNKIMASGKDIFATEKSNIAADYAPVKTAIDKYYGPAMVLPETEKIKKQAAGLKESAAGYAGLPSGTERQMEGIATWQAGSIVDVQRTADLAKAGAEAALAGHLGDVNANVDQALSAFELQTTQQRATYEPGLRMGAVQGLVSNQFVNPEAQYATAAQGYSNMYSQELQAYQVSQQSQLSWISAFAKIGTSVGAAFATGGLSVAAEAGGYFGGLGLDTSTTAGTTNSWSLY